LDPGLCLSEETPISALFGSIRPTFDLFELLVLFRIQRAMICFLGPEWRIQEGSFTPGALLSHDGTSSRFWNAHHQPTNMPVEVAYQPIFTSQDETKQEVGRKSLSAQRRPDFTISVWSGPELVMWTILDAKYRASRVAVHERLADMHVYRDALRWNGKQCEGAFIVVPALAADAVRYADPHYLEKHRFGALVLGPPQTAVDPAVST
jgi:hypothetical protein